MKVVVDNLPTIRKDHILAFLVWLSFLENIKLTFQASKGNYLAKDTARKGKNSNYIDFAVTKALKCRYNFSLCLY